MCSADAELLACCEGGRNESAAGVRASGGEVIVGFIGMGKLAIGEGGLDGAAENSRCDYCGSLRAPVSAGEVEGNAAGRQLGTGDHGGEGIENMMFGFEQDVVGKGTVAGLGHVGAEDFHDVADFNWSSHSEARKHRGSRNEG